MAGRRCAILFLALPLGGAGPAAAARAELDGSEEALGLVQRSTAALPRGPSTLRHGPWSPLTSLRARALKSYCARYPAFCRPPFDCDKLPHAEVARWALRGVAAEGGPDLRSWCFSPQYYPYVTQCTAGDVDGAGHTQFRQTVEGYYGESAHEAEGSYCFVEGFCVNEAVTNETTLAEAAQMCDERLGRRAWRGFRVLGSQLKDPPWNLLRPADGSYNSTRQTRVYVEAACAMGNYHCDVRMCHETYCKEEYYVRKYGHFLRELGWAGQ